jgi:peptidoglycan/xylan/chitin deacetylase (PgdA/CDA1 family)
MAVPVLVIVVILLSVIYLVWRVRYVAPPHRNHVLCFHKISDRFCWEGTWTTPRRFFAYIDHLQTLGYRFVGMDDYLDSITSGRWNEREILVTFDDGYAELHQVVLPGLEARGIPFHVFLVTDFIGKDNTWDLSLGRRPFRHLDWREIENMAIRGVTFGSHGATHGDFTAMTPERVREEMILSKSVIENRLGKPVTTLSYPFGRYNESVRTAAKECGYNAAFSLYPSHPNTIFDRFAVRRNGVYIIDPVRLVQTKIEPGPLFWFEEMKCRAINAVACLTPAIKRFSGDSERRARGN